MSRPNRLVANSLKRPEMGRIAGAGSRTRSGFPAITCIWVGLLLSAAWPNASYAQSDASERFDGELEKWIPSVALEVGIFGHSGKGNVDATLTGTPRIDPPSVTNGDQADPNVVRAEASREDITSALVGADFEIMTPAMADISTHPRLFLDLNISAVLTNDVGLARDADPGEMGFPPVFNPNSIVGENTVAGRGTKITVQQQGPQIHAGLGAALTFDFGEQRIRVKPSFVYSRIKADIFGVGNRAVRLRDPSGIRDFDSEFRTIELSEKRNEVYHGIGPAVEVEYETGNRLGPFSLTLFLKGHASHLLGDLKTRMQQTNPDPTVVGDETIRWKYSQDRWVFRASTGIRFRLVPKSKR